MAIYALTILAVLGLPAAWFLIPHGYRKLGERRLARVCRDRKLIVLSFDDGPGARLTPKLLDLLEEHDVRASFFILGRNAAANPGIVQRMVAAGHEVGSHTYDHSNAWKTGPITALRDVERGRQVAAGLGADPALFRPPFGKLTLAGLVQGLSNGMRFGWWTAESGDTAAWGVPSADALLDRLRHEGGVVLMHDFERGTDNPGTHLDTGAYVLDTTRRILEQARETGHRIVPLSAVR